MSVEKNLQDAFRSIGKRGVDTFSAEVISIDKSTGVCEVKTDDLEFTDVRLASVIDANQNRQYLFPKVGSSVLVSPINEDLHNLYVEAYSEIEEYYLKIEDAELNVTENGILIKKGNENLQKLMIDFLKAIKRMKFTTNTGSTIQLVNIAEFEALEPRFKNLLKTD
ncbi:hypothetical protein [Weeksella virosa]|uniref:Uncharacterized protein n=1 Tax=Weeksella virosa (strain ATCC 43766 / DSM 16922 / JCM 21250 / CCUG 30538 / CDC 9751 / IAM 14551 / NBRC 16016 / NCTC 11634 / CL345/78) TaxID=865938 RepID=F0P2U2_WEEVC|nr:hypothetical protein [Weeksella virosa]ADX66832.1 hypothetical protein Weevi_0106 [Weeksella virosa DSM 16922]VEH63444.1 Uncharacterised protein [Weeksella virosa]